MQKESERPPVFFLPGGKGKPLSYLKRKLDEGGVEMAEKNGKQGLIPQRDLDFSELSSDRLTRRTMLKFLGVGALGMSYLSSVLGPPSVAEAAGGRLLEGDEVARLQEHYRSYWQTTHPEESKPMSLWDRLYVMLVAVGVWSCTWLVRRRGGLV